jgi:chromosome segregation ATPase
MTTMAKGLTVAAIVVVLGIVVVCGQDLVPAPVRDARLAKQNQMKAMKQSDAWQDMQTKLDQYQGHYDSLTNNQAKLDEDVVAATNKIALVADAATKLALNKVQNEVEDQRKIAEDLRKTIDDCHDALVKLVKCFKDYVAANE